MGDVGFIVDCAFLYDKANPEIEPFAVCLGMNIHSIGNKGEGTFHQQLPKLLSPMLFQDRDAFKFGSLFSLSDSQGFHCFLIKGAQKVCTRYVPAM